MSPPDPRAVDSFPQFGNAVLAPVNAIHGCSVPRLEPGVPEVIVSVSRGTDRFV